MIRHLKQRDEEPAIAVHPWDINDITKGWQLTPSELEQITGMRQGTKNYSLAVMGLQCRLRRELAAGGDTCCVAIVRGNLRVLTDAEAVLYTAKTSARGVRQIQRAAVEMTAIEVANLSDAELDRHQRNMMVSNARVSALRGSRAAIVRQLRAGKNDSQQ